MRTKSMTEVDFIRIFLKPKKSFHFETNKDLSSKCPLVISNLNLLDIFNTHINEIQCMMMEIVNIYEPFQDNKKFLLPTLNVILHQ